MPVTTPPSRSTRSVADERGAGLLATLFGLAAFFGFLLLAVQVLASLHAASVVTGVAYDAATRVAAGTLSPAAATEQAVHLLGPIGERAELQWDVDDDQVQLRVVVDGPQVLADAVADVLPFATIDRTVTVRRERPR